MSTEQPPAVVRRGTNLDRVGGFNDTVVLDAIRRAEQRLSRVEIAAATGLSGQAISNITRRLLDAGLVREAGRQKGAGLGKPRTLLELEPTGQYAVGVHLDPAVVTVVVLDLTGQVVARRRAETPAIDDDPGVLIEGIAATVEQVITEAGAPRERVVGVGIAAPGPIDVERGVVVDPPNLAAWHLVPLRDALRERTGLPVLLDKDVTAAASAEKWAGGPNGRGSFVFFYLGTGIGAGLVIGDEVVRGSSSNVGEIGHVIVDPDGPLCYCGRRGCVGETSQPRYLVQQAAQAGVLAQGIDLDDRHAVDVAFARAVRGCGRGTWGRAGDRHRAGRADRQGGRGHREPAGSGAGRLRRPALGPAGTLLRRVRPGGAGERFLVRSVHRFVVSGTALGADVGAVGAASLVLDHTFSPNPSVLLLGPAESAPPAVPGSAER